MPNQAGVQQLSDKRYVTLVLRLLVDQTGEIRQGVVVDVYEKPVCQFHQAAELPALIIDWLVKQADSSMNPPNIPAQ